MRTSKVDVTSDPTQPTPEIVAGPVKSNGAAEPPEAIVKAQVAADAAALDEYERLAADTILDDDDDDEPGAKDEISALLVVKKLPRFANFRANTMTFDLWGTVDEGMDAVPYVTTKSFAPNFEDDVELKRVRFFETVTSDGVVRLVYCFVPGRNERMPNLWTTSKLAALVLAQSQWTTMRSRQKLQQYTFRPSRKDYGEPKFSGLTREQYIFKLKEQGLLITSKDHPFFKKATDTEE